MDAILDLAARGRKACNRWWPFTDRVGGAALLTEAANRMATRLRLDMTAAEENAHRRAVADLYCEAGDALSDAGMHLQSLQQKANAIRMLANSGSRATVTAATAVFGTLREREDAVYRRLWAGTAAVVAAACLRCSDLPGFVKYTSVAADAAWQDGDGIRAGLLMSQIARVMGVSGTYLRAAILYETASAEAGVACSLRFAAWVAQTARPRAPLADFAGPNPAMEVRFQRASLLVQGWEAGETAAAESLRDMFGGCRILGPVIHKLLTSPISTGATAASSAANPPFVFTSALHL
jgi:hypothetical protein